MANLPQIVVPQTLRQPKPKTNYVAPLMSGFQAGYGLSRQRALDALQRKKMEEEEVFRRAVQDRIAQQHADSMAMQRDQLGESQRQHDETFANAAFERRQKNVGTLLSGFEGFQKDGEVATATAPFYDEAKGYAEMMPGESMDDPVLRGEVTRLVGAAQSEAGKVYERKANLDREKASIMGDRVAATREKMTMLSDPQTKEVSGYENTIRNVDRLANKARQLDASGKYPGLYAMKLNQAARYLEGQDVDTSVLNAMMTGTLADYIFQVSGKAVTEQEFARLRQVIANQDDTLEVALGKLDAFRQFMADRKTDALRGFELQGKRVNPGWHESDYAGKPSTPLGMKPPPGALPSTFTPDAR